MFESSKKLAILTRFRRGHQGGSATRTVKEMNLNLARGSRWTKRWKIWREFQAAQLAWSRNGAGAVATLRPSITIPRKWPSLSRESN